MLEALGKAPGEMRDNHVYACRIQHRFVRQESQNVKAGHT
jgi:hypothetical protein